MRKDYVYNSAIQSLNQLPIAPSAVNSTNMATDADVSMSTDISNTVYLTLTHHGVSQTFSFDALDTISDLSEDIAEHLKIPPSNQKIMVSKMGLLKPPFKDPNLSIALKRVLIRASDLKTFLCSNHHLFH